jgi:hypothetical protein
MGQWGSEQIVRELSFLLGTPIAKVKDFFPQIAQIYEKDVPQISQIYAEREYTNSVQAFLRLSARKAIRKGSFNPTTLRS